MHSILGFRREIEPEGDTDIYISVCYIYRIYRYIKREKDRETETERETDFKELAHMTMGLGKSKICRRSQQAGDPAKS